jgi:SAM-dependent methyltransferase
MMSVRGHAQNTTWSFGDYPAMARLLEPVALTAVKQADIVSGQDVLDIACGDGNAALQAAARGARVTGVDYEPVLLDGAARRAEREGRTVTWIEGDAVSLPVPSASADTVLSVLGIMYAQDQLAAANEVARVLRPGGRAVLTAWSPGSFMPSVGRVFRTYLPPVEGPAPSRWADRASVGDLLLEAGLEVVDFHVDALELSWSDAEVAADFLIRTAGHVICERDRLLREGRWSAMVTELTQFVTRWADDHGVRVALEYGTVTAVHTVVSES